MRCIAVVTSGDGWGIREMMHKAFFYNMPVAFGTAITSASWNKLNIIEPLQLPCGDLCV